MLEKYKICPLCGKKNYPGLIECIDCEQDLTQVRITDDESEKNAISGSVLVRICDACGTKNPPNARKCVGCGEEIFDITPIPDPADAPTASKEETREQVLSVSTEETSEAVAASTPISKAPEVKEELPATVLNTSLGRLAYHVTLTTLDQGFSYTLTNERTVLGRSEEASDYLSTKPYVSRVHCALTVTAEGVFLEDLNHTNYTFVNNTRAVGRVKLENGDTLALGGMVIGGNRQSSAAYFTVAIV